MRFRRRPLASAFWAESRTGMATVSDVPELFECIVSDPPKSRTRSLIPARPTPVSPPCEHPEVLFLPDSASSSIFDSGWS